LAQRLFGRARGTLSTDGVGARYQWDEKKRQNNLEKHGIDFDYATEIWDWPILRQGKRYRSKERRFLVVGKARGRIIAVVYTNRQGHKRIISARPASREERAAYEREAW
jgi:uncharacterized DUF497 family protein